VTRALGDHRQEEKAQFAIVEESATAAVPAKATLMTVVMTIRRIVPGCKTVRTILVSLSHGR
ncbi:MAG TPA: hypothetical protein VGB93_10030, partial [Methylovirgula sp.]